MIMKIYALLVLALLSAGCSGSSDNSVREHAGMNHNSATPAANSSAAADHDAHADHSSMASSPDAAAAEYDLQFIDTMIAHHQGAVDMARLIEGRSTRKELISLGTAIISSQQKEIEDMRSWRERWFAGKPPAINMDMAGMRPSMQGMDMKKLTESKGNDFDLEFIRQMIPHHEGAVVMAREASERSTRPEIKKLAAAIIADQQVEIDKMRRWASEWNMK